MRDRLARVIVVLFLAVAAACGGGSPTRPSESNSTPPPVVVALGDSLTDGVGLDRSQAYPTLLQQKVRDAGYPHRVVNAGISGDTTADGLRRLDGALVPDTQVLILALGANDGLQGIAIDTIRRNLSTIIEAAQRRRIRVLLCGMETPPFRGLTYSLDFHAVFPDLADRFDLPLMPFLLAGVFGDPAMNLGDNFHPNAAGHRRIADNMWPYLEPLLRN